MTQRISDAKLLRGLDGTRLMSPSEAIDRITACVNAFTVVGVKVAHSDGQIARDCPVNIGHRSAITFLNHQQSGSFAITVTTA